MGQKTGQGCEDWEREDPLTGHTSIGNDGAVLYLDCDCNYIIVHICQKS